MSTDHPTDAPTLLPEADGRLDRASVRAGARIAVLRALLISAIAHAAVLFGVPPSEHAHPAPPPLRVSLVEPPRELAPKPLPVAPPPPPPAPVPASPKPAPRVPDVARPTPPPKPLPPKSDPAPPPVPATPAVTAPPTPVPPVAPSPIEAPAPARAVPSPASAPAPAPAAEAPATPPVRATPAPAPAAAATGPATPPGFGAAYLANPQPDYPRTARRRGEEGTVYLRVRVSPAGVPLRVTIDRSSGFPSLDQAALDRVSAAWKFTPARRGDEAVEGEVIVPIVFRLAAAD